MKIFLSFILIFAVFSISAQTREIALQHTIDSILTSYMTGSDIVGLSIGIIKDNKVYYTKGYGNCNIHSNKRVDPLTNFHTASVSKLFTATAIMQLAESGRLDINRRLVDYLPGFTMEDKRYKQITIKQMLNHTSGLPYFTDYRWDHPNNDRFALKNFVLLSKFDSLQFSPGTDIGYSNLAFDILGYPIEKLTNENFDDYLYTHILSPSGMTNSDFDYRKIDPARRSVPHTRTSGQDSVTVSAIYPYNKEQAPCGTLNSCAYDLSKWMLENLAIYIDSNNNYKGIIKHETLMQMWTPTHDYHHPAVFLGLGWWKRESKEYGNYFFHCGLDIGYSSSLTIFPEKNFGIVLLCNGDYPSDVIYNKIPFAIRQLFN